MLTGHPVVDAIANLPIRGNIVHHGWYRHVRYSNKRGQFTDPWACLILADIVYWYRPTEIRDELTGDIIGYRKKFAEDKLQRSPNAFAQLLGCSVRVIRDALLLLETLGIIDTELRSVKTGFGNVPTCMFIGLNPERLSEITYLAPQTAETLAKSLLPISVRRDDEMGNKQRRNGVEEATISVTSSDEIGNSSIYRDFSKNSLENTHTMNAALAGATPAPQPQSQSVCENASLTEEEEEIAREPEVPKSLTPEIGSSESLTVNSEAQEEVSREEEVDLGLDQISAPPEVAKGMSKSSALSNITGIAFQIFGDLQDKAEARGVMPPGIPKPKPIATKSEGSWVCPGTSEEREEFLRWDADRLVRETKRPADGSKSHVLGIWKKHPEETAVRFEEWRELKRRQRERPEEFKAQAAPDFRRYTQEQHQALIDEYRQVGLAEFVQREPSRSYWIKEIRSAKKYASLLTPQELKELRRFE